MDIQTIKNQMKYIPSNHTVLFKGAHGLGKTEVVRWIAEHIWHQECVEFQASQISDVGDLIGLMRINEEKNVSEWVPPYWYKSDKPICLFFDELNRGTTMVTNAMMQLSLDHRILNFKLPEGSHIIVAINPGDNGEYDVDEFDNAKKDRFVWIDFDPTVQDWLDFAKEKGIHSIIRQYISKFGSDLDPNGKSKMAKTTSKTFDGNGPSRRSWFHFNDYFTSYVNSDEFEPSNKCYSNLKEVCAGYLGIEVAGKFVDFYKKYGTGLDAESLMTSDNFEKDFSKKLKELSKKNKAEIVGIGNSVANWLHDHEESMVDESGKINEYGQKLANNFYLFLTSLEREPLVEVYTSSVNTARKAGYNWVKYCSKGQKKLLPLYINLVDTSAKIAGK